jgi:hypothetical protein
VIICLQVVTSSSRKSSRYAAENSSTAPYSVKKKFWLTHILHNSREGQKPSPDSFPHKGRRAQDSCSPFLVASGVCQAAATGIGVNLMSNLVSIGCLSIRPSIPPSPHSQRGDRSLVKVPFLKGDLGGSRLGYKREIQKFLGDCWHDEGQQVLRKSWLSNGKIYHSNQSCEITSNSL